MRIIDIVLERQQLERESKLELPAAAIQALRAGAGLSAGVDHPGLTVRVEAIPELLRESLIADLA